MNDFGWTDDPAILAVLADHIWGGDDILNNRKDGGIHKVWVYPLGHFDDGDPSDPDPIWTRVDLAWGRYFKDGCTFLIWEGYTCRAGKLEDAQLFVRGINEETPRTKQREENRRWMELVNDLRTAIKATSLSSGQIGELHRRAEDYREQPEGRWAFLAPLLAQVASLSSLNQHEAYLRSRGKG
jgi:hypothetical protein